MNSYSGSILITFLVFLLGCTPSPSVRFEKTKMNVSDLPEKRIVIQISRSGFVMDDLNVSHQTLHQKLQEMRGASVYCEADKFSDTPITQVEALASTVIESGGRFFYRQGRGAIDSILSCYEWRKVGRAD